MTFQERTQAVARMGFTDRQARFFVTVMQHSGVCVPRQYARFARIAYAAGALADYAHRASRPGALAAHNLHVRRGTPVKGADR